MTYVNPTGVITCGVLFPILGAIAVALRFMLRLKRKNDLRVDDWICLPALALLWAEGGLQIAGAETHSFGWHSPSYSSSLEFLNDDEYSVEILGKLQTAFDLLHPTALGLLKLSVLFFYRRIFRGPFFNVFSQLTIAITILWILAFTITIAAACGTHFAANWASLATLKEECVDTFRMLLAYSISDVFVDLVIIVMPIPLIFGLQMPLRRKFAVCGAILIGALAIACGITRMVIFIEALAPSLLANARVAGLLATDDIGVVSLLLFWGMVELGVGMIAICLPTLRPLFSGWSAESIIRSIRSTISLRSIQSGRSKGSKGSGRRTSLGRSMKGTHTKLTSESSLTAINMNNLDNSSRKMSAEGIATDVHRGEEQRNEYNDRGIIISREFHVRDDVV